MNEAHEGDVMTKYLFGILFLLWITTPICAQQLVPLDDRKDPCSRFKMRILVPPDYDNAAVAKPSDSIDLKMVWNPCGTNAALVATLTPPKRRDAKSNFVFVNAAPAPLELKYVPIKPAPFLNFKAPLAPH
jgi:hypothetical protein